jgi:hypothetical protein
VKEVFKKLKKGSNYKSIINQGVSFIQFFCALFGDCQKFEGWEIINITLQICNNYKKDYLIFISDFKRFNSFFQNGIFFKIS